MNFNEKQVTQERLKEALHYDPETGIFTRLVRTTNSVRIGDVAGTLHHTGYRRIWFDEKNYLSHRLAWLYMMGEWPQADIDHVNGVRDDNRFVNLREATGSQNQHNRKLNHNNACGYMGVSWYKVTRKWRAHIMVAVRTKHLGYFTSPEDAYAAYCAAKSQLHEFNPIVRAA